MPYAGQTVRLRISCDDPVGGYLLFGQFYIDIPYNISVEIVGRSTTAVDHRVTLTANVTQDGDDEVYYSWSTSEPYRLINENGNQATFMWFEAGTYNVLAMAYTDRGGAWAEHTITVTDDTNATIVDTVWIPGDTVVIPGDTIVIPGDTIYLASDTVYIPGDTVVFNIHDTTIVYRDTLTLVDTVFVHDTTVIYRDTLIIHDTIYIGDSVGIVNVSQINLTVRAYEGGILVGGAEGRDVQMYDAVGRLLATRRNPNGEVRFEVPATGAYLIKVDGATARRVVVVK